jgi:mRNA interferase MazF
VKRAEIWTVPGGADHAGKPGPAVIIQDDHFDTDSVTICPFTTDPIGAPLIRLAIEPNQGNALDAPSRIMVDKVTTVRRAKLGRKVGVLDDADEHRFRNGHPSCRCACAGEGRRTWQNVPISARPGHSRNGASRSSIIGKWRVLRVARSRPSTSAVAAMR